MPAVTMEVSGAELLERVLNSLPANVLGGVKVIGEQNAIKAMVWEFGSARLKKPGPKTLWSTNPLGQPAILTLTAPYGFIRVNSHRYREILLDEFKRANFPAKPVSQWKSLAQLMLGYAAERCAHLIAATAPIDTGDLRASIVPVTSGDEVLGHGGGKELDSFI